MSKEYNSNRARLNERLERLNEEPLQTPIQEVRPVEDRPAAGRPKKATTTPNRKQDGGTHINFWVPEELGDRLKIHAIKSKKSIKQICIEALEAQLGKP